MGAMRADACTMVWLGTLHARVEGCELLASHNWGELVRVPTSRSWTFTFLTPATFRSGNHASPLPSPGGLVRSPSDAWAKFGPDPAPRIVGTEHEGLWFSDADVHTVGYEIGHQLFRGALGNLTLVCGEADVARKVSRLAALAVYSGVGSFRGKGMGIVQVVST